MSIKKIKLNRKLENLIFSILHFGIPLILWFGALKADKYLYNGEIYNTIKSYIPEFLLNNMIPLYVVVAVAVIAISTMKTDNDY